MRGMEPAALRMAFTGFSHMFRPLISGGLMLVSAWVLVSIEPAASSTPAQTPAFRTGVQMLEVDARVFDRAGRFITDLGIEEFEILENGAPQQIQTLFLVGGPGAAADASASQASVHGRTAPHTWIFIFDHRHLLPSGFVRATRGLEAFMTDRFRAGDLAGIVTHDKMVDDRISSVRSEFLAALRKVAAPWDALNRAADRAGVAQIDASDPAGAQIAGLLERRSADEIRRAARATIEVLDELARGLARMAGPKTVVLFSDGFGLRDIENTLRTVVGRMNRAGARIYVVDTRGLAGPPVDTLNSLANDTGGLVMFNLNNIGHALDEIAADTNVYYVLGYQPANSRMDGKYRSIEVRVKRPGVRVRARKGYLAVDAAQMLVPVPVK